MNKWKKDGRVLGGKRILQCGKQCNTEEVTAPGSVPSTIVQRFVKCYHELMSRCLVLIMMMVAHFPFPVPLFPHLCPSLSLPPYTPSHPLPYPCLLHFLTPPPPSDMFGHSSLSRMTFYSALSSFVSWFLSSPVPLCFYEIF